jgi:DNA-binding protein H-NS
MAADDLKRMMKARDELDAKIAEAQAEAREAVLVQVREMVEQYGLTEKDVFGRKRGGPHPTKGTKVAPKYQNPKTGETWTGRGRAPKWMGGKNPDQFLIK